MVMRRNAMRKNLQQSILKSLGRYLAIVMIIALGASMFVGLLMTKSDMVATGQKYMDEQNMFDLRLISPYGWDKAHAAQIARLETVADAEGILYLDAVADMGDAREGAVYRFYEIPERMNRIVLRGGRMPEKPDECLADGFTATDDIIGTTIQITEANEEATLDAFVTKTFTVVGYVSSPLYMDMNRGNTSIGSGSLASYFYVPSEALDADYYAEIHVTIPGEYDVYTDAFNDAMELAAERIEPMAKRLARERVREIRADAMEEYQEGLREYEDGLKTYEEEKAKALQELEDAYNQLVDAENAIAYNQARLTEGQKELKAGKEAIAENEKKLEDGRKTLEETKAALYAPVDALISSLIPPRDSALQNLKAIEAELAPYDEQIAAINASIADNEAQYNELRASAAVLDGQILDLNGRIAGTQAALGAAQLFPLINGDRIAALKAELESLRSQRDTAKAERDSISSRISELAAQLEDPWAQRLQLQAQRAPIEARRVLAQQAYDLAQGSLDDAYGHLPVRRSGLP